MGGGILLVPESESNKQARRRLTRRATVRPASVFVPRHPDETPEHHFPLQTVFTRTAQPRFVNRYDSREILIAVDGSCLGNGRRDAAARAAGCSFKYKGAGGSRGPDPAAGGTVGFGLERRGPGGEPRDPTSNRAKLRAVIAALEFREWHAEGWRRVVLATDLEYVVLGATRWLPRWVRRRWRTRRARERVANRDLWEELNGAVEGLRARGTEVSFWLIPPGGAAKQGSALVRETKRAAREAAVQHPDSVADEFTRLCGIMV
ncbi:hypothetical protein DL762_002698 [Monosporascus cannonballus]|uniref:RNase H type-1 domain-containing protein n=1 Tax=Monosporascus cannonballus TaxID=155416 RepID=A0ABY0HCN9_9PEZI|nr:hypothetical protein DL762_002698 [Monosporascus cannonballus]